jgi:hypothetical protein
MPQPSAQKADADEAVTAVISVPFPEFRPNDVPAECDRQGF